jgi:hypothetical protein
LGKSFVETCGDYFEENCIKVFESFLKDVLNEKYLKNVDFFYKN